MTTRSSSPTAALPGTVRHIFLSYSSHDHDLASGLRDELEARGVNVWLDVGRMRPGSNIVTELERAIEGASAFVVLVTASSLASGWVREECGRAIGLSIRSAFRFPVIPVAVEGVEVPGFLANRRVLRLSSRSSLASAAAEIAAELSVIPTPPEPRERRTRIRWHSRSAGFENGDISVLAIVETVAAAALIVALSTYSGSLAYVTGLALIAPLALLQTDYSRSLGVRLLRRLQWWTFLKPDRENESRIAKIIRAIALAGAVVGQFVSPFTPKSGFELSVMIFMAALFYLTLFGMTPPLLVRSAALIFTALRHPLSTLRAVPTNWKNLTLCKDLLEEPEIIPGYLDAISTGELSRDLRLPHFLRGVARRPLPKVFCDTGVGLGVHFSMIFLSIPVALLLYLPYYSTRWALKSTAVIWAPLLWLASTTNPSALPLRLRLRLLAEDATSRVIYAFSWLTLAFLAALWLGLFPHPPGANGAFARVIMFLRQPSHGVCLASAALIAIGLRLFASRALLLYFHRNMPAAAINVAINMATFIQRLAVLLFLLMLIDALVNPSR